MSGGKVLRYFLAGLCVALAVFFLLPLVIGAHHIGMFFPAAVLGAIGGDLSGDEFDQMERLSSLTGVPVPPNLADLRGKTELHTGVIEKDEMQDFVLNL